MVIEKDDPEAFLHIIDIIAGGGLAIIPCDTIYGIVGRVPDTDSAIRAAKGRGEEKPFLSLYPSAEAVKNHSSTPISPVLQKLWPGPLTLVIRTKSGNTDAVRVPADAFLIRILSQSGPLYSTSVNLSGQAPLWRSNDIIDTFGTRVDLIVDAGDLPNQSPSTILDVTSMPYRIIRNGACRLPAEVVEKCE